MNRLEYNAQDLSGIGKVIEEKLDIPLANKIYQKGVSAYLWNSLSMQLENPVFQMFEECYIAIADQIEEVMYERITR